MDDECVHFQFNRHGYMHFWVEYYHEVTVSREKERTWIIDKKANELSIFRKGNLEFSFKPISERKLEFIYDGKVYVTTEITMKKNK